MSEELKPCPFCGGEPYLQEFNGYTEPQYSCVRCHCGVETKQFVGFNGKTKAIEVWNRRV